MKRNKKIISELMIMMITGGMIGGIGGEVKTFAGVPGGCGYLSDNRDDRGKLQRDLEISEKVNKLREQVVSVEKQMENVENRIENVLGMIGELRELGEIEIEIKIEEIICRINNLNSSIKTRIDINEENKNNEIKEYNCEKGEINKICKIYKIMDGRESRRIDRINEGIEIVNWIEFSYDPDNKFVGKDKSEVLHEYLSKKENVNDDESETGVKENKIRSQQSMRPINLDINKEEFKGLKRQAPVGKLEKKIIDREFEKDSEGKMEKQHSAWNTIDGFDQSEEKEDKLDRLNTIEKDIKSLKERRNLLLNGKLKLESVDEITIINNNIVKLICIKAEIFSEIVRQEGEYEKAKLINERAEILCKIDELKVNLLRQEGINKKIKLERKRNKLMIAEGELYNQIFNKKDKFELNMQVTDITYRRCQLLAKKMELLDVIVNIKDKDKRKEFEKEVKLLNEELNFIEGERDKLESKYYVREWFKETLRRELERKK